MARGLFVVVGVVAGLTGVVMLAVPEDTGRYFAWALAPSPVATLVGAFYVASAILFVHTAVREDWPGARGLCLGILALTLPTLVATVHDRSVFDFGRWQAVTWVVLFVTSPLSFGTIVLLQRGHVMSTGPPVRSWARLVLAAFATAFAVLALVLWFALPAAGRHSPFPLQRLGGHFLGSWAAFLAATTGFAAARGWWDEARTPVLALLLWPLAALLAAVRSFGNFPDPTSRDTYFVALVLVTAVALAVAAAGRSTGDERR